jgi:hypothetical protein
MRRARALLLVSVAACIAVTRVPVRAQSDAKPLAFEVASVKVTKSGTGTTSPPPHDMYVPENFSLGMLIQTSVQGDGV